MFGCRGNKGAKRDKKEEARKKGFETEDKRDHITPATYRSGQKNKGEEHMHMDLKNEGWDVAREGGGGGVKKR